MFGVAMESGAKQALSPESAAAADIFDQFVNAQTFKSVQGTFRLLCETLRIKPTNFPNFYPKLKAKLRSWKAQALWTKFDKRASHRCYNRGKACANVKVLIIGAGPCGLRAAIEAQLLGAKVVVIEKRDRFSRNNVLHLWPFVIHDLRNLGGKKFYGKFCAGAIDHISIRQLQCILLKVALLLGVEIHENVAFDDVVEPVADQSQEKIGWKASVTPRDHPLSQYEFNVLIGADGKRNTLKGFKRKEFRGKLAIAITANFINRHSEAEARVQEISGVAFIFNQKFFQDLRDHTGIDLENIVYYKDETHYFVMTAKKYSLIEKGVILNDYADTARLLAPENVSKEALFNYAREAADFSTNFQMPHLDFAVNHYGQEDVAMFDFTSMYAAESACRVVERRGHRLFQALVGDSLLEPFWPTGSGCARGFLSSLDACWMIRSLALGTMTTLQVLAERESIHRLLAQTTPENLSKDYNDYTLNPSSRYPNFNSNAVRPAQVRGLYDTDAELNDDLSDVTELPKKKRKRDSLIHPDTLLNWCQRQVILYKNVTVEDMTASWKNGLALCAIVHRYRPDLIDFHSLKEEDVEKNNQLVFDTLEREFGIQPVMTGKEMAECSVPDVLSIVSYMSHVYETFRGEIPHIVRAPTVDLSPEDRPTSPSRKSPIARLSFLSRLGQKLGSKKRYSIERIERGRGLGFVMEHDKELERERADILKRIKKRRSLERDRALFILNKDAQQATLTGYKRTVSTTEDRETFSTRVKDLEEKLYGAARNVVQTSPNAPRVVGKLDRGDWNIRMLEEKLKGQKTNAKKGKEEVPKWNRDMFEDKLRAMDQRSKCEYPIEAAKYMDFDSRLQMLDKKLKEGNNLEIGQRGSNKVSAVAEQLSSILDTNRHSQPLQRSNSKPCLINTQSASESCHFCGKRVYLMERQSAQGKFFHRGCFKCECCGIALRLSSYGVATEGSYCGKFLCMHHFTMRNLPRKRQAEETRNKKAKTETTPKKTTLKSSFLTLNTSDLTDSDKMRGVTPERVEFENTIEFTSEEELLSEIDEDEWTDRNFGMSANELDSTDDESDFSSDEAADEDEEELEEAFQHSLTKDQTWKLAETWKRRYFRRRSNDNRDEDTDEEDDDDDYNESEEEYSYEEYENEDDDESTATEGEVQDGAGEGPSELMAITPDVCEFDRNEEVQLTVPKQMDKAMESLDYRTLKSGEETDTGSERTDSEEYTDSDTETESETADEEGGGGGGEKGIEGDEETEEEESGHKARHRRGVGPVRHLLLLRQHSIPTIVIDEMTTKAPDEDDDTYYTTLQEQSLKAERTLEDLIGLIYVDSLTGTPEEEEDRRQLCIVEDICPLVTPSNDEDTAITPDSDEISQRLQETRTVSNVVAASIETEVEVDSSERVCGHQTVTGGHETIEESLEATRGHVVTGDDHVVTRGCHVVTGDGQVATGDSAAASATENGLEVTTGCVVTTDGGNVATVTQIPNEEPLSVMATVLPTPDDPSGTKSNRALEVVVVVAKEPDKASNQELSSSLPDLAKGANRDLQSDIGVTSHQSTESPTAKMMLKLKEKYLLGSSDSISFEDRFPAVVSKSPDAATNSKLEPVVKSFLELISEKQKMLSQASSPSPTSFPGLIDSSPSSPSSLLSPSSSSEPSYLKIGSSSSWSKISPISPLENTAAGGGDSSSPKVELGESPSALSEEHDTVMSSPTTTLDDRAEEDDSNVETLITEEMSRDANESSESPAEQTLGTAAAVPDEISNVEKMKDDGQHIPSTTLNTFAEDFTTDMATEQQQHEEEEMSFDHIDTSFVTFRKKKVPSDTTFSVVSESSQDVRFQKELNEIEAASTTQVPQESAAAQSNCEELESVVVEVSPSVSAAHESSEAFGDSAMEDLHVIEVLQAAQVPTEPESVKEEAEDEDDDVPLGGTEQDTDSLMAMFVHSSDSDTTPSLDESIYASLDGNTSAMKVGSYTGRFSERVFPFGGVGVRDSINIRKSAMKRHPMPLVSVASRDHDETLVDSNKEPESAEAAAESAVLNKDNDPPSMVKMRKQTLKEPSVENLDEIPFADDESIHESSSSSEKKDQFFTERTKFKRSLHRPLSMVETLLSSTLIEVPKKKMLPDTPFIDPEMYGTPKTMMEIMDDLRQLRTVEREKARQEARERARLKSDEELGLRKVDYTNFRKKYQKPDAKLDFDIVEEASGLRVPTTTIVDGSAQSPVDSLSSHSDRLETGGSHERPAGLPDSSSPDSEVFEQQHSVPTSPEENHVLQENNEEGREEEHSAADADVADSVVPTVQSPESSSTGSNVRSSSDDSKNLPSSTLSSPTTTTTTSKTDHASSYLEPDLSIEDPVIKDLTAKSSSGTNNATSQSGSSNWSKGMTGLMSRKDKSRGGGGGGNTEKIKAKERKSFLSLFANFGKGKDDKKKDKSPPPSSSSGTSGRDTPGLASSSSPVSPLEGSGIRVDGTPKESRFQKLRLARSKEKAKDKRKRDKYEADETPPPSKEGSCSPPLCESTAPTPSSGSLLAADSLLLAETMRPQSFTLTLKPGDITLDRHALIASMASISRQIPEKVGNGVAPQASEDSFSDTELENGEEKSQTSSTSSSKKLKDYSEERRKKFHKIAQRVFRQQEQKRLRTAQEIQRQLEELEVKQRELETRGVQVEKALRGEGEEARKDETRLMQEWFRLVHAKNVLLRHEQELMVKAKELELEDRHSRLQHQLHERMAVDDVKKDPEEIEEEGRILSEMLEILEQRDNLIELLEENRRRHQDEDKDLETTMQTKGMKLTSPTQTQAS